MLGLLLVVTFIANYLATTLPAQMATNDVEHDLTVEDQVGLFATLVADSISEGVVGTLVSQPITLASMGDPPFAGPDGGTLSAAASGSTLVVSFSVKSGGTTLPFSLSGPVGAAFTVHLQNSYAPPADVAYDEGGVIFAQAGGIPVMIDPPAFSLSAKGALNLTLAQFLESAGTQVGTGTTTFSVDLSSATNLDFPTSTYVFVPRTNVTIMITSRYAGAWENYFETSSSFSTFTTTCTTTTTPGSVCPPPTYSFGGATETITLSIPVASVHTLNIAVGSFAVTSG
jgi:hypothetical protein